MLYTIAYPKLGLDANARIADLRRAHDPQDNLVGPHFTLLFGSAALPEIQYLKHVEAALATTAPIEFACRYAMSASHDGLAFVYLVPDEGFSALSKLHDKLYGGAMADELRTDIPFIPHITVAAKKDRRDAKRLGDELNERGFSIHGRVEALTVVTKVSGSLRELSSFLLCADQPAKR